MRIKEITSEYIEFDNGNFITFSHYQACCENNYADFKQIEEMAYHYDFDENLLFEGSDGGFRFGDNRRMFYIPCYSEQNDYYSMDIDICYSTKDGRVINELNTDCEWSI